MPETITYKQFMELKEKARGCWPGASNRPNFSPRLQALRLKIAKEVQPFHVELKLESGLLASEQLIDRLVFAVAEHLAETGDVR